MSRRLCWSLLAASVAAIAVTAGVIALKKPWQSAAKERTPLQAVQVPVQGGHYDADRVSDLALFFDRNNIKLMYANED